MVEPGPFPLRQSRGLEELHSKKRRSVGELEPSLNSERNIGFRQFASCLGPGPRVGSHRRKKRGWGWYAWRQGQLLASTVRPVPFSWRLYRGPEELSPRKRTSAYESTSEFPSIETEGRIDFLPPHHQELGSVMSCPKRRTIV